MNEDNTQMSSQEGASRQGDSMAVRRLAYALVFIALLIVIVAAVVMVIITAPNNDAASRAGGSFVNQGDPNRTSWGVDLSEVGFGQVDFGALWFVPTPPMFFGSYLDPDTSRCQVNHHPEFDPELPLSEQPGALSFGATMMSLAENLFKCGSTDFTNSRDWYEIADSWLFEYNERCGDLSFNRIGWPGDPEIGPGIECVPHFEEFIQ